MKKLILVALFVSSFVIVHAQKKVSFSIRTGYGAYTIHGRLPGGENFWLKPEECNVIATDIEFPIARKVYLQPGIQYNQKGANFDNYLYMGQHYKGDVKLSYVEIPVNIVFKPKLGSGHFFIGAGPYLGRGIGREAGVQQGVYIVKFKTDVSSDEVAENPFYFSPWDAGANFITGYQFRSNLFLQLNGQVGMKRINASLDNIWTGNTKHRNIGAGFSIGYRF